MKLVKTVLILILLYPITVFASTKAVVDITTMSITDLAEALDKGYLTSELLVTLYLERIEAYNDDFNAIRKINDKAKEEARVLDEERKNGQVRSLLHGIPIVVKTNIDVTNIATTAGSLALSDNMPKEDAEAIKKLKENSNFRIPVIALTADAVSGAKEKYVSEGFVDYIAKPFNKDQIKQKLDIIFNDRNMSNTNKR